MTTLIIDNLDLLEFKHSSTNKYTLSILTEVYIKQHGIEYLQVEDYNGITHLIQYDPKSPITLFYLENRNGELKVFVNNVNK